MKWIASTIALCLTACFLHAADGAEETRAASRLKLAERLHATGRIETAKEWYADIAKRWPNTDAAEEARRLLAGKTLKPDTGYVSSVGVLDLNPRTRPAPNSVAASQLAQGPAQPSSSGTSSNAGQTPPFQTGGGLSSADADRRLSIGGIASPPSIRIPSYGVGRVSHFSDVGNPKVVHVRGYTRKNGTYVNPYTRSLPRR